MEDCSIALFQTISSLSVFPIGDQFTDVLKEFACSAVVHAAQSCLGLTVDFLQ
jgi:hypothetical protein